MFITLNILFQDRKHKSKKKSKDRDKDNDRDCSKVATPTVSPGREAEQQQSTSQAATPIKQLAIPKIKMKLGGNVTVIQGGGSE